jgi:hypothetical protein
VVQMNDSIVAYFTKKLVVNEHLTVKFDIWDTAGQGKICYSKI